MKAEDGGCLSQMSTLYHVGSGDGAQVIELEGDV